ncbi:flavin-containing monooxygenase [Prauserella cavernicola]|uniref:NAD(P)/FAD-dependent oxidoreductase n=1 Tax=Prauserella cavernicola TaxID=2800127 RepID=A0A934QVG6_9PSEU|nr:NAD(P)/FAD-dependent oxidoreductase [Prauserella cavernicola]MBK1787096.1 NAD(P)/FAD-dependent oxidoreductase [Prauserella cavernicola]
MTRNDHIAEADYDVVVVGAGISGIYQLYRLTELGLRVRLLEAGSGVGGTWYWNRYPGCRFDLESYSYGYFFSQELLDEWTWSEEYASQPETERYLNLVVDKFGLRENIQLNARVTAMVFDDATSTWATTTEDGTRLRSTYVITAVGILSAPIYPPFPGREDFRGETHHTALWPHSEVDFRGKRVAVVGTGSSGVQIVQTVAPVVKSMVVLQRTPNWCTPLNNGKISSEKAAELRRGAGELHERLLSSPGGTQYQARGERAVDVSPEQRLAVFEELYEAPGMSMVHANFSDVTRDKEANDLLNQFLADKIRERVKDPETAERLIPKDHGFGQKRPPLEIDYYEAFNQDNVRLVATGEDPVERITETGIRTSEGFHEVDMIVFATGFEAVTGSFHRIDIRGHDGVQLREHWAGGPRTHLGIQTAGFPNLFMVGGPQSTTGNIPRYTEVQADWVTACIRHMREQGFARAEVTPEAEDGWSDLAYSTIKGTLQESASSWAWGTNVPGKRRTFLLYGGGLPRYRSELDGVRDSGYQGVVFTR